MARPGVNYQDIASAAAELKGLGKAVTIENIRNLLGTGSIGTINKYLRQWRETQHSTQQMASKENLPESLISLIKGLWENVLTQSREQFVVVEEAYKTEIARLITEVEKYKNNNQRWQKLFYEWQQEKAVLANEKLTLEQALDFSQKENTSLLAKQDACLQQLQDKQVRIDELNRLHKQVQDNLEHYRESTREQRLLMQHQFDQQKQEMLSDIKRLQESLEGQKSLALDLQQELHVSHQMHEQLEKTYSEHQIEIQSLKQRVSELNKENNDNQQWQQRFLEMKTVLENKVEEWIISQSEIKIWEQKYSDQQVLLGETQNLNKLLSSEKWILVQEKAKLEGELKQMHRLLPV